MQNKWLKVSLLTGVIGALASYFLIAVWQISLTTGLLIFIFVFINNPKKRFLKVFWVLITMFFMLNHFAFKIIGELFGISFNIESNMIGQGASIALIILAIVALALDFFERQGKLTGTIFESNKNSIKDVSGENIHIYQNINSKESDKYD